MRREQMPTVTRRKETAVPAPFSYLETARDRNRPNDQNLGLNVRRLDEASTGRSAI